MTPSHLHLWKLARDFMTVNEEDRDRPWVWKAYHLNVVKLMSHVLQEMSRQGDLTGDQANALATQKGTLRSREK